jgi:hypothetical protein
MSSLHPDSYEQVLTRCYSILDRNKAIDVPPPSLRPNFFPTSAIEEVSSEQNIDAILALDPFISRSPSKRKALKKKVLSNGTTLFALAVYNKVTKVDLLRLLESDDDDSLPFDTSSNVSHNILRNQYEFLEHPFRTNRFDHVVPNDWFIPDYSKYASRLGHGANGSIYTVYIEWLPSSTRGMNQPSSSWVEEAALKTISHGKHAKQAYRERSFLTFLSKNNIGHDHITRFYFGFQFHGQTYLLSERANEGDLLGFTNEYSPENTPELNYFWFLAQLRGLAGALALLHGQPGHFVYIHDIKLENILVFKKANEKPRFKFTDWDCAKVIPRKEQGSNPQGNPGTLPPETNGSSASFHDPLPHDVWSLGCVFLELMIWYFEGTDNFDQHRKEREDRWENYYEIDNGVQKLIKLARDALTRLKRDKEQLANIVGDMLEIDPKKRLTAAQLVVRLKVVT